jgi:asparagine synthase (glutamine-hydrolysing)
VCGIAGVIELNRCVDSSITFLVNTLHHRGPDDDGIWVDNNQFIALAHRRLSILDLSPAGQQPMHSPCGRFTIVFNGEIYNHLDLRQELAEARAAFNWRGHSDTETLLAGLRHWGIENCLKKLNGMFAFALWDSVEKQLFLARDRMGEKPLYYGRSGDAFLFGSELKALAAHPHWQGDINRDALASFMRYNHVPGPQSIYKNIYKLQPAHYVVISQKGQQISDPRCYWSLGEVAHSGMAAGSAQLASSDVLENELDSLLRDAVGLRMLSDVPLGAFLSGGYDSTMIVAQMQAQSSRPVKTFSIGNENAEMDEAKHAAAISRYLGTDHTELYVTADDALSVIPKLPQIYDEPFADSSQIPTFLVSQLARREVTVALSGDGGDELFAGYNRHVVGPRVWRNTRRIPQFMRHFLGQQLDRWLEGQGGAQLHYLPSRLQRPGLSLKLSKLAAAMDAQHGLAFYDRLRAHWKEDNFVLGSSLNLPYSTLGNVGLLEQMLYQDMQTYLPDDILTKVDRASMAVSLEARVPFLDHRLVEFSWRVPSEFKVREGRGKWLLRQVLERYIPRELMERPKQGFGVPIAEWLRGPLRDWAESLLNESRIRQEGFINAKLVRDVWRNHLAGRGNREHDLWCVLMFQSWLEANKK